MNVPPPMTPQDALTLLDGAVAHLTLTRLDHARLLAAVDVLRTAITPAPPPSPSVPAEAADR